MKVHMSMSKEKAGMKELAVSNIQPTTGQWMNRNAAPGHLMTMTLFVKLDTDLKEMWYEHLGWIHVV